tara:strand:- start:22 stop:609 length:588 start_codon:yes stop_codon:yes gene_type:complete
MEQSLVCGVDEVARGCLFGRVYTAAVIWDTTIEHPLLKDSKKLTAKKRSEVRSFIEDNAIDFAVSYSEHTEIDKKNILRATLECMHESISKLNIVPEKLMIDGTQFIPYKQKGTDKYIPHECIIKGDALYPSISAASILAKVYHDEWIHTLVKDNPELDKYGLQTNMGYGTKKHLDAIKEHGPTEWHRMSFAPMK